MLTSMTGILSSRLQKLVDFSVTRLGSVIRTELGNNSFQRIENLRRRMTRLRSSSEMASVRSLRQSLNELESLSPTKRLEIARSFTLMLELMNTCENAYRSYRIGEKSNAVILEKPESITCVITAHPTEARSPENIRVFHEILAALTDLLEIPDAQWSAHGDRLEHWIRVAWQTSLVRSRKPGVDNEAEHLSSIVLRDETLRPLLQMQEQGLPLHLRSWVGGDKDGHPGVDEVAFLKSLQISRSALLHFVRERWEELAKTLDCLKDPRLKIEAQHLRRQLASLKRVGPRDGGRVLRFRQKFFVFAKHYEKQIGLLHPLLRELQSLFNLFPSLVIPLEFRESSDVLIGHSKPGKIAIDRMLATLARISKGGNPKEYVASFVISMASTLEHLQVAAKLIRSKLGDVFLPIVPLFEQAEALQDSPRIVSEILNDRTLAKALRTHWQGRLELMVGYSDSSKESGVLFSRLRIAEKMHELDRLCARKKVVPVFFQGSGGSVDRGGGSVEEQTGWWPAGALRHYKVTIQGEMVERSFANASITRGQMQRIASSAATWKQKKSFHYKGSKLGRDFADRVAQLYRERVHAADFLQMVEAATPYRRLNVMKFGSRPAKRSTSVSVEGLRAIPWVLCWTQTRTLFPTWWGVGTAWRELNAKEKRELKSSLKSDPAFSTYARALAYTLLKVELPIWRMYLEQSHLEPPLREKIWSEFQNEFAAACEFSSALQASSHLKELRPWLAESIYLRSPMIHPLNLLQILAMKSHDVSLLRVTVAGISAGMMTTG